MAKLISEDPFINSQLKKSETKKIKRFPKSRLPENIALQYSKKLKAIINKHEILVKNQDLRNLITQQSKYNFFEQTTAYEI